MSGGWTQLCAPSGRRQPCFPTRWPSIPAVPDQPLPRALVERALAGGAPPASARSTSARGNGWSGTAGIDGHRVGKHGWRRPEGAQSWVQPPLMASFRC